MHDLFGLNQLLLALLIFMPIEWLFAARPQKILRRGLLTDAAFLFFNGLLVTVGVIALLIPADIINHYVLPSAVSHAISGVPFWGQVPLAIIIGDFGVYWVHRIMHAVQAMWQVHAVHHAVEELDWLAAVHQHPLDLIFMKAASLFPLFALGFPPETIAAYLTFYYWQSWLSHANVRLAYGPLRYVLVSPEFHHWHHSSEIEARDKNFAGVFSLYDVLFGSVHLPEGKKPTIFGVDHPMPSSYLALLAYPFVAWTAKRKRDDPPSTQHHMSKGGEPAQPRQSAPLS